MGTYVQFMRAARFLNTLNITCNFYIYCFTVTSFRLFIKDRLFRWYSQFRRKVRVRPVEGTTRTIDTVLNNNRNPENMTAAEAGVWAGVEMDELDKAVGHCT